jgi:hypothetical protein
MVEARTVTTVIAAAFLLACAPRETTRAVSPQAPAAPEVRESAAEVAVRSDVAAAAKAFVAGDARAAEALLSRARALAAHDIHLENRVAMQDAAFHVERSDLEGAARIVRERIAVAQRESHASELDLHDRMLFLCEARGDRTCALLEAIEMRSAVERLPPPWSPRLRQGYTWQRAHTLLHFAQALEGDTRAAALRYAHEARDEFAALARQSGHALQSIDLLDEEFQALEGDCAGALATARALKVEELDPQDLYTTSRVFARCGDAPAASRLRERIARGTDVDLFDSVYRYLAKRDEAAKAGR